MAPVRDVEKDIKPDVEIEAIKRLVEVFGDETTKVTDKLTAEVSAATKELNEKAIRREAQLRNEIAERRAKGMLESNKQAANFLMSEMEKQQHQQQKEKLTSEIEILQYISKEKEEERKKELETLKKEQEILELRADGNETDARKKEKELAIEKKKEKRQKEEKSWQEEDADYEFGDLFDETFKDFRKELKQGNTVEKTAEKNLIAAMKGVGKAITDGLNAINTAISNYARYQAGINARLQGVSSYSNAIDVLSDVAYSPLLKTEDLYSNLADLVNQGIVTNVEQRAMFATVKDSIATTFDVTSDSLKRLIRVQQNDSTAARLGMEAYLTKFLNVYVENTEYLQSTFDSVSSSLLEASAMMSLNSSNGAANSAELEFVIQKWLGTLSGVGFSDSAAQSIANAIGQLGSGDVDSLSSSDIQNLIVMGASKAGLSYGGMLSQGLDAKQANDLMLGVVKYLQEVADTGTNVVKNQLAKIFGVTVSDLVAVSNLNNDSLKAVHNDLLSYQNMYGELEAQFDELPSRLGISNILENLFSNFTYQTGMGIASNPVTYAIWKITDLITMATGGQGINIPFITAMGNGFDFNATVENLMKLGIVGTATLGGIGKIIGGLSSIGNGSKLLDKLKVSEVGAEVKTFGGTAKLAGKPRESGMMTSETTYVGNTDSDTYYNSTINAANDEQQKKLDAKIADAKDPVVAYFKDELDYAKWLTRLDDKLTKIIKNEDVPAPAGSLENTQNEEIPAPAGPQKDTAKLPGGDGSSSTSNAYDVKNNTSNEEITNQSSTNNVDNSQNAVPNVNPNAPQTGSPEYDKYMAESGQGVTNNTTSTNISNNADVSDYLVEIDFANGFKLLVDNVSKIKSLLEEENVEAVNTALSNEPISGFTQYTFDK